MEDTARVVAGRYTLQSQLGRGGMGTVWRAHDELLRREVAVKEIVLPLAVADAEREKARTKVLREARAAARLASAHCVTVFDVAEDDARVFIVMELVDAPTLSDIVVRSGPLPPREAALLGLQLVDALEEAHRKGIVHRDVKPSNVLVKPGGVATLTDFGIASLRDDPTMTSSGALVGSPSYMAPEQARGEGSTPATDLWGLGATLYFAVEGERPFDAGQPVATLHAVVTGEPVYTDRSAALAPVLRRLLGKDPAERPSTAEARRLLEGIASGVPEPGMARVRDAGSEETRETTAPATAPLTEPVPASVAPVVTAPPAAPTPRPARPPRPARRRPWGALTVLAVLLLAAGLIAAWQLADDGEPGGGVSEPPSSTTSTPTTAATSTSTSTSVADPVDGEWVSYTDDATGYEIDYPSDWQIVDRPGNATDFSDPATGSYLRVDWIQPPGDDPVKAWKEQEKSFRDRHGDYEKIQIEPDEYQGHDAAIWEYTYDGQHAVNLGFVTDEYGFALNFQTPEELWGESEETFEQFEESFEIPGE